MANDELRNKNKEEVKDEAADVQTNLEDAEAYLDDVIGEEVEEGIRILFPWEESLYDYQELFRRVPYNGCGSSVNRSEILNEGKKTIVLGFMDLYKSINRQPAHVITFLRTVVGMNGSLDGEQRLVIKGRISPQNIAGNIRKYMDAYVNCHACKNPDTTLSKEKQLLFVKCENCGAATSVLKLKLSRLRGCHREET